MGIHPNQRGIRWVVNPGDGETLGQILDRAGFDAAVLSEGRAFVGRRRARAWSDLVRVGDVVAVAPARVGAPRSAVVLGDRGDLIAVEKPAGMPTIADLTGSDHCLHAIAARTLGLDPMKLHPTSRLDRDVSGVVIFATSSSATLRLAQARLAGTYSRRYVALGARPAEPLHGEWNDAIGRVDNPRLRGVGGFDSVSARTHYSVRFVSPAGPALFAVAPETGRTHQIRVHSAHAGAPLVGDASYGGPVRVTLPNGQVLTSRRIALHAAKVVVPDSHGVAWSVVSKIPEDLVELGLALGIGRAEWEGAVSWDLSRTI